MSRQDKIAHKRRSLFYSMLCSCQHSKNFRPDRLSEMRGSPQSRKREGDLKLTCSTRAVDALRCSSRGSARNATGTAVMNIGLDRDTCIAAQFCPFGASCKCDYTRSSYLPAAQKQRMRRKRRLLRAPRRGLQQLRENAGMVDVPLTNAIQSRRTFTASITFQTTNAQRLNRVYLN